MSLSDDPDTGFIVICAMRYAIGRKSYAPGLISQYIKRYWNLLDDNTRRVLKRDLAEELNSARALGVEVGRECDHQLWIKLLAWMGEQK